MFNKTHNIFLLVLLLCNISVVNAQDVKTDSIEVSAADLTLLPYHTLWFNGNNAAGIRQDLIPAFGRTTLGFTQEKGEFKLAQKPMSSSGLNFTTERFQNIGKMLFYGKFSYTQQSDKGQKFSDVLNPYRGTPYILADSIGGDWKKQLYGLTLKAVGPTMLNKRLTIGLGATLNVGTGARQNDPRPLSTNNEITLSPSLTYKLDAHSLIGINGLYSRYREDISLEVKNSNINHYLYKFLGLGQYELPTTFTTGASRIYQGNKLGGDVQYQLVGNRIQWLSSFGYRKYTEEVSDGTSVPRKSGTWKQSAYTFNSNINIKGSTSFQRISLRINRDEDSGIEFHEFYNTTLKVWQTLLEAEFYSAETDHASLSYAWIKPGKSVAFNWLVETGIDYFATRKTYAVPAARQEISFFAPWIKGTKVWAFSDGSDLQTGIGLKYVQNLQSQLAYIPITGDRTFLARNVLYPDQAYLSADYLSASLHLQYDFKVKAAANTRFFASGNLTGQSAVTSNIYPNAQGSRTYFSFNLGVIY